MTKIVDSHDIDKAGGIVTMIIGSNEFVHALNDDIAMVCGILTIVWFSIRIYVYFTTKKIE